MARPLRIEFEGAFYHITARDNERRSVFLVEEDFHGFLDRLGRIHEPYGVLIHAYVLMTSHYHLLLETPRGGLTAAFHDSNTAYTNYFNRGHPGSQVALYLVRRRTDLSLKETGSFFGERALYGNECGL